MKIVVYGTGAVGARSARQVLSDNNAFEVVLVDKNLSVADEVAASLGPEASPVAINAVRQDSRLRRFTEICKDADAVIMTASEDHVELIKVALRAGCHVVSVSDDVEIVEAIRDFDQLARSVERNLVIGAGFSPGLSCLLARHSSSWLDVVDEIHVAKFGTGGPECASQHHKALRVDGVEWRDQRWIKRRGGTGRELCWFPDPVGGFDCFYGGLVEPGLLLQAFPGLVRVSARVAATRRDIGTKWLPMLRKPHPEGLIGAIRVELRGWKDTGRGVVVVGALDRPAVAAGTVAAAAAMWAIQEKFLRPGAGGLAELIDEPVSMLHELASRGVKAAVFEGIATSS